MSFQSENNYWATCQSNEKFIIIQTRSGLGMTLIDHLFPPSVFTHEIDNETLGNAVLQALQNSRTFTYGSPEDEDFFDEEKSQQRYDAWVSHLCETLGYKTKRALFKKMKDCSIWLHNGEIKIRPSRQVRLEVWDGFPDSENVTLFLNNDAKEIGAALRLALNRCL